MPYTPTMPKNRTLPAIGVALLIPLAAWAQSPSEPAKVPGATAPAAPAGSVQAAEAAKAAETEAPTEAETFLDGAIKAAAKFKTVSADVVQTVDMLDQKFRVNGRYLKAPDNQIRLELKVEGLPDAGGEFLQVCDGKTLWDVQQVLETKNYRRIEVGKVFEKIKTAELDDELREQVLTTLGLAGPEELLKGLRRSVRFNQPKTLETLRQFSGKQFWVLRGEWQSRVGLTGPNQAPISPTAPLPAYMPSLVVVHLGKDDLWPYQIRLVGRQPAMIYDTRKIGPDGHPIGAASSIQKVKPTEIVLSYENVKLDTELSADEFVFSPPSNVRVVDQTQEVVGMLDQTIQVRAAQKKAEAAKAEDPLLKESIPIPRADGPAQPAPSPLPPAGTPK